MITVVIIAQTEELRMEALSHCSAALTKNIPTPTQKKTKQTCNGTCSTDSIRLAT